MTGPEFPMLYGFFLVLNHLKREVIVYFVDIGRIVDHHCFKPSVNYTHIS